MAKVFFDDKEMTKAERDRQVKERANYERNIAREEARAGVTARNENEITFLKEK